MSLFEKYQRYLIFEGHTSTFFLVNYSTYFFDSIEPLVGLRTSGRLSLHWKPVYLTTNGVSGSLFQSLASDFSLWPKPFEDQKLWSHRMLFFHIQPVARPCPFCLLQWPLPLCSPTAAVANFLATAGVSWLVRFLTTSTLTPCIHLPHCSPKVWSSELQILPTHVLLKPHHGSLVTTAHVFCFMGLLAPPQKHSLIQCTSLHSYFPVPLCPGCPPRPFCLCLSNKSSLIPCPIFTIVPVYVCVSAFSQTGLKIFKFEDRAFRLKTTVHTQWVRIWLL